MLIHFTTQKQSTVRTIVEVQPIAINRQSERSSTLVDKIVQWCLVNTNKENEEFLTRDKGERSRRLTRRDVVNSMKVVATHWEIDPARISSHSIRRSYATGLVMNNHSSSGSFIREGWVSNSQLPTQDYAIPPNVQGGLSYTNYSQGQFKSSLNGNMVGGFYGNH